MATNREAGKPRRKYEQVLLDAGYTPEPVEESYTKKREYNRQYRANYKSKVEKEEARRRQVLYQAKSFLGKEAK